MRREKWIQGWPVRPQLWIGLLTAGFLWVGMLQMSRPGLSTTTEAGRPRIVPAHRTIRLPAEALLAQPPKMHTDCAKVACLVLSFDDGPNPITTPQVLDILSQYGVRADFFVVGSRAAAMPDILRRMHKAGHEVGNHTWSHPDLTKLSPQEVHAQIAQTQAAVIAAGLPAPHLFRPPYGAVSPMVKSQIHLTIALWNIDPEDWRTTDPNKLTQKVIADAKPGGVVDMHDIDPATATALPAILQNLQSRFQLVTMSELLNLSPGQHGEFYGR